MKKSEIKKGRFYSDGKLGLREVVDEGPQFKLYENVSDVDCLRYRVLSDQSSTAIQQQNNMTRTSFAAWAKSEIPAEQVHEHLIKLGAQKLVKKLTSPQRAFLLSVGKNVSQGESVERARSDFRVAYACWEKFIVSLMPVELFASEKFFKVSFTELGIVVIAILCAEQSKAGS